MRIRAVREMEFAKGIVKSQIDTLEDVLGVAEAQPATMHLLRAYESLANMITAAKQKRPA